MTTWSEEQVWLVPHLMCDQCGQAEQGNLTQNESGEAAILTFFRSLGWHRYEKDGTVIDLCEDCAWEAEQEGWLDEHSYKKVY
jgi:hypothetical protein